MRDYMPLWPKVRPGSRPELKRSVATFLPKPRIWLRSSHTEPPAFGLRSHGLLERRFLGGGLNLGFWDAASRGPVEPEENWARGGARVRQWMGVAGIEELGRRINDALIKPRDVFRTAPPIECWTLASANSVQPAETAGLKQSEPLAAALEPSWRGTSNPRARALSVATEKEMPLGTKAINSYSRRFSPRPRLAGAERVFLPPTPKMPR